MYYFKHDDIGDAYEAFIFCLILVITVYFLYAWVMEFVRNKVDEEKSLRKFHLERQFVDFTPHLPYAAKADEDVEKLVINRRDFVRHLFSGQAMYTDKWSEYKFGKLMNS